MSSAAEAERGDLWLDPGDGGGRRVFRSATVAGCATVTALIVLLQRSGLIDVVV